MNGYGLIEEYSVDPYYILQSIALRKSGSTKRGDVLRLDRSDIEAHWESVCQGYEDSLRMLREECGVLTPKWMPYQYLLVAMGACWNEAVAIPGPSAGANRERFPTRGRLTPSGSGLRLGRLRRQPATIDEGET